MSIVLKRRGLVIFVLGLLSAVGPFSIDMYLPGFKAIAKDLGVSVDQVSYSLSSFFIGICLGQLLWGPLLDKFGRKKPLFIGLSLYIIASIFCAFTTSVQALIGFRFLQALGSSIGVVAPRAMIRDIFPVNENAKIFSYMILVLGLSPILAPTAGGFITANFGWHAVFITLGIIGAIVLLCVIFFLPESSKPDPEYSLSPRSIFPKFLGVLKVPQFVIFTLVGAFSSSALFAYLSGSPYVFMELYAQTEQHYGYIFSIIAAGLILCSQLNNLLLKKYTSLQILKVTTPVQASIGILLVVGTVSHILGLYSTIALIAMFLSCQGFTFPNATALSLAPFTKNTGSASALSGSIQMGFAAIASAAVGLLNPQSAIPMVSVMFVFATFAVLSLWFGLKKELTGSEVPVEIKDSMQATVWLACCLHHIVYYRRNNIIVCHSLSARKQ